MRPKGAPPETACLLCGASTHDRYGNVRHEAACPHFMRGPDPGGDPYEWPTLFDVQPEEVNAA